VRQKYEDSPEEAISYIYALKQTIKHGVDGTQGKG
jgi:hypothetical protein